MKRKIYPLEHLMLQRFSKTGGGPLDITDATGVFGVYTAGHKKWDDAHKCMAFIALRGLEREGLTTWSGSSRELGHRGWHGGLWYLTDEGKKAAEELEENP